MIIWDESKRQINIQRHGIDFADCTRFFDSPVITKEDSRYHYGEQRLQSLGLLDGMVVFICWVEREQGAQLISVRKATKYEQRYYFKHFRY
jgi:uncharacterized DUF497 family protein